jgi:hypothetical protein
MAGTQRPEPVSTKQQQIAELARGSRPEAAGSLLVLWGHRQSRLPEPIPVRGDTPVAEVAVAASPPWAVVVGTAERAAKAVRAAVADGPRATMRGEPVT